MVQRACTLIDRSALAALGAACGLVVVMTAQRLVGSGLDFAAGVEPSLECRQSDAYRPYEQRASKPAAPIRPAPGLPRLWPIDYGRTLDASAVGGTVFGVSV